MLASRWYKYVDVSLDLCGDPMEAELHNLCPLVSSAGPFVGPMVVSMRPIPMDRVADAVRITGNVPQVHGAPVHTGAPEAIGIHDLATPDFGDPVPISADEVPVFWACGVTPQAVALAAGIPLIITHAPGHMFVGDVLEADLHRVFPAPQPESS